MVLVFGTNKGACVDDFVGSGCFLTRWGQELPSRLLGY